VTTEKGEKSVFFSLSQIKETKEMLFRHYFRNPPLKFILWAGKPLFLTNTALDFAFRGKLVSRGLCIRAT